MNPIKCLILINSQNSAFQQEIVFFLYFWSTEKFSLRVQKWLLLEKNQELLLSLFVTKGWCFYTWLNLYVFFFLIRLNELIFNRGDCWRGHVIMAQWGAWSPSNCLRLASSQEGVCLGETPKQQNNSSNQIVDCAIQGGKSENRSHSAGFRPLSCHTRRCAQSVWWGKHGAWDAAGGRAVCSRCPCEATRRLSSHSGCILPNSESCSTHTNQDTVLDQGLPDFCGPLGLS